jgi:predicted dehydrogenase
MGMINVGVIGFGYWGPNIVRNLTSISGIKLHSICDTDPVALMRAKKMYPEVRFCQDYTQITDSPEIDAVAVITPVSTHFTLAKRALSQGKHVFVEKVFTRSSLEAYELIKVAEKHKRIIMVDHTFLFTDAVKKIETAVSSGKMGDLYYYDSVRISPGRFQTDVNVVWDLAVHDLYIMDHIIKSKPQAISAQGIDYLNHMHENIAYITVYFDQPIIAHINVNWLSPVKVRNILIGGQKKMMFWDDLEPDEKIKIYDRGIKASTTKGEHKMLVEHRSGDVFGPKLNQGEALKNELTYFKKCIIKNETPFNDGHAGLRVVKLLEATNRSLKNKGMIVPVHENGHVNGYANGNGNGNGNGKH